MLSLTEVSAQIRSNYGVDLISNLPESILSHILSLLPTEEAVATSILSKKWKFKWRNIHTLRFDDSAKPFSRRADRLTLKDDSDYDSDDDNDNDRNRIFGYFVNKVLLLLNSGKCINNFYLSLNHFSDVHYVTTWIEAAVSRNVKLFEFYDCVSEPCDYARKSVSEYRHVRFQIPSSLFTCKTLVDLSLKGVNINLNVPNMVSLPNLKTLRLTRVFYQCDDSVTKLISGCSSLESLFITRDSVYDNVITFTICCPTLRSLYLFFYKGNSSPDERDYKIKINAPQLRSIKILGNLLKDYSLENLCLLDEAHISLRIDESSIKNDHYSKAFVKLLQGLYNAKKLILMGDELEAFSRACFSTSFPRLSQLTIPYISWTQSLLNIFEGSKKLESLTILKFVSIYTTPRKCWSKPEKVPICLFSCLKTMSLIGFKGLKDELEMIAYILKNAEDLRRMIIQTNLGDEAGYQLLRKVHMFPQGSKKCKLHFLNDCFE